MPTISPVSAMPIRIKRKPTALTRVLAMTRAAPLSAITVPNIAPRQMIAVIPPSMSPTPRSSDAPIASSGMPNHSAASSAVTMNATKGGTSPQLIRTTSSPISRMTARTVTGPGAPSEAHSEAHTIHASEHIVEVRIDAVEHIRLRRRCGRLVEQVVDLEIGADLLRGVIRAAEVHVRRALHRVVIDRRMHHRRDRAIRLTLDVFVAVHAVTEPTLGQGQAELVALPALREVHLPVRD